VFVLKHFVADGQATGRPNSICTQQSMQQWQPEGSEDRNKINQQRNKNNNYTNGSN